MCCMLSLTAGATQDAEEREMEISIPFADKMAEIFHMSERDRGNSRIRLMLPTGLPDP